MTEPDPTRGLSEPEGRPASFPPAPIPGYEIERPEPNPYRHVEWTPDLLRIKLLRLLREQGVDTGAAIEDGYSLALDYLTERDLLPEFVAYVEGQTQ